MENTKLERVIRFKQKPWMKKLTDKTTEIGTKSAKDFDKLWSKYVNCSLFSKQM